MYQIREAPISELLALGPTLFEEHSQELTQNKRLMVLEPDAERYLAMDAMGLLLVLLAYEGDDLVGYSVNVVTTHLHYKALTFASNDLLYVAPAHRGGRLWLQLRRETRRVARERGAVLMLWHAKEGTTLAKLLPRMGCKVQDIIFSEEL